MVFYGRWVRASASCLIAASLLLAACQAGSPTAEPLPGSTKTPANAPTPTPTRTPAPTAAPTATRPSPATPTSTSTTAPTRQLAPTATPGPFRRYENDIFGLAVSYPSDWDARTGIDPQAEPILGAGAPAGFPRLSLTISYLPEISTLEEAASGYEASLEQVLSGFQVVSRGPTLTAEGTPAQEIVLDFTIGKLLMRASAFLVVRGSQVVELFITTLRADYSRQSPLIEEIGQGLSFFTPAAFGIPREEALTIYQSGPLTLDPHLVQDAASYFYVSQIFSGLVAFDRDLNIVADLAETWEIEDGGKTYIFHLRGDARFHDGRPVTAQDFKYSIERAADRATGFQTARVYLDDILGVTDKLAGLAREVRGVDVIDERTLRIRIDAPKPYFLAKMTSATAFVVDRDNVEAGGHNWSRNPNGTGPFKLKKWRGNQAIALERNDHYYRGPAQVRYVVVRFSGGLPTLMYETGEVDVAWALSSELERVLDPNEPMSKELTVYPQLSVFYVALDATRPPFNDPKVRLAFALALDREELLEQVHNGSVTKASGFLPPGLPGHNPELGPIPFDPVLARQVLAETSYQTAEGLPELIYAVAGSPGSAVAVMLEMWRTNLGVTVPVQSIDTREYFYGLGRAPGHLLDYGWVADYPDPQNFLDILFHSRALNNLGRYSNPQVDAILEEARTEGDEAKRLALYQRAEELLVEDVAAIPLWHGQDYVLVKPHVKDWHLSPQGLPDLRGVRLER